MSPSRRRLLGVVAAGSAAALAGCSALEDAGGSDGSDGSGDGAPGSPEEVARTFVDRLFAGEYEAAFDLFSETARRQSSPARVERLRLGYAAAVGTFESIEAVETGVRSGYDAVELTLAFAGGEAPLEVVTNAESRIRGAFVDGEYEPASYAAADAFEATDHTLDLAGCELGATMTVPTGADDVPGVVLVHGSGPLDRDGTLGANKPYRDVAEGLASRGVAALRYDKRTLACEVPPEEHTVDRVTVDDALAAVEWFRGREAVAPEQVTVVGHSLGAMMAPEVAARDGGLAGVVGLATPARPLEDVFLDQVAYLADVGERTVDAIAEQRDAWERAAERVREGDYDPDERPLTLPGAFWASVDDYDPVERAVELDLPQAYLQGGRDYQVSPEADFGAWEAALGDAESVALAMYPDLDHLFLPGYGPSVPEAYAVPNQVAEAVVADLASLVAG